MNCPLCKTELLSIDGNQMYPGDPNHGVTVYCPHKECPSREVSGHGKNLKDAYGVVLSKFGPKSKK